MSCRINIRADASNKIGLGHIIRCLALAHVLKKDFQIAFFCNEIPQKISEELKENGFELNLIGSESDFFDAIALEDFVVLDGYNFDTAYQEKIKATGAVLICIDDLHNKEFVADLIINHAPRVKPEDYKVQPYTRFALGLDYVLLRPAFLEQAKKKREIGKIETVLICFGGSDYKNLTHSTLKIVSEFLQFKRILVVTGSGYKNSESLVPLVNSDKRIEYYQAVNESKMLELMLEADLAIVPASGILFETLAAGCNVMSGYYAANQEGIAQQMEQIKGVAIAGNFLDLSANDLKNKISKFLFEAASSEIPIQKNPIDGKSPERLLKLFLRLSYEKNLKVRKAKESDAKIYFDWANDKEVRYNSTISEPIEWERHVKWFNAKLADESSYLFVFEFFNSPVGQVRFDFKNGYYAIDYSVDKRFRKKGVGELMLGKGIDFLKESKYAAKFEALVKIENRASSKIFEKLDFNREIIVMGNLTYSRFIL